MNKLSVIIPTLNEASQIANVIKDAKRKAFNQAPEIIVVDCGSMDNTEQIAISFEGVHVHIRKDLIGHKYASLNYGASKAIGDILFFLDADSQLPWHYDQKIINCLSRDKVIAGAFDLQLSPANFLLKMVTLFNKIRYRFSKNFFGDQDLFITTNNFIASGGYPKRLIMESAYYCRKLKKMGKLKVIPNVILTSSRRFLDGGIWKVLCRDMIILILFNLHLPIEKYAYKYWQYNKNP